MIGVISDSNFKKIPPKTLRTSHNNDKRYITFVGKAIHQIIFEWRID